MTVALTIVALVIVLDAAVKSVMVVKPKRSVVPNTARLSSVVDAALRSPSVVVPAWRVPFKTELLLTVKRPLTVEVDAVKSVTVVVANEEIPKDLKRVVTSKFVLVAFVKMASLAVRVFN